MLTTKLIFTSVVFLLNIILVYTHEYNSVCNQLCGGTSTGRSSPSSSSTTQGLPGKRGPKGQKGDSSTYEENEEQNRKFAGKLESLQKQLSSVQELQGPKGDQGQPGVKGQRGEPGVNGDSGVNGSDGKPGMKGDRGDPGVKGDRGQTGRNGDPGVNGVNGSNGKPGLNGDDGQDCNVTKVTNLELQLSEMKAEFEEKLNASQKEVSELKELITQITDQLNKTLLEKMNDLKTDLTDLNGAVEDIKESVTFSGRTCKDLLQKGYSSNGVYIITAGGSPIKTFCDMDAGGYIVFQRRFDGSTDFDQTFQSYSNGFGDLQGEYWLGLEKMHQLTKNGRYQLRVDLQAYDNEEAYALYDDFSIGSGPGYQLNIGTYTGTAGDSLTYHNKMDFTTTDNDVDDHSSNCAVIYQGAWWFGGCHTSNLNALIYNEKEIYKGMSWALFKGYDKMMKTTKMMFREM